MQDPTQLTDAGATALATEALRHVAGGQIVGLGSVAGTAKCGGFSRSMKSSSGAAAASRLVKAGRFHFVSIVASTDVWS